MVRLMAAADTMQLAINNAIKTNPAHIRQAIHGKVNVKEALNASGILDAVPPADAAETRWVCDQLSEADNQTALHAIDSALAAGQIVRVSWSAGPTGVSVTPFPGGVTIGVQTAMPPM